MRKSIVSLIAASISAGVFAQSGPEVTPYRPGVLAGAALSATGQFEIEVGYDFAKADGIKLDTLGALLKYGMTDTLGFIVGLPYARVSGGGSSVSGVADGLIGMKFVAPLNKTTSAGFQLVSSIPSGESAFRADNPTLVLTAMLGGDLSGTRYDLNLGVRRAGDAGFGSSRETFMWAAALARPIGNGLGVYGELSGTRQSGAGSGLTGLAALTYSASRQLALDVNVSRSRFEGTNGTGVGVGMAYLFR